MSSVPNGVSAPYDVSNLEFCNIVYMCIKQINASEYHIPSNLESLVNTVISDVHSLSEDIYENDHRYYCYLTIKKMYVQPNSMGNRDGWHIDGFGSDQHNFIWCDDLPTQVSIGKYVLTNDHNISLGEMAVQGSYRGYTNLLNNMLYEMDQQCVHRPTINNGADAVLRTFIKLTYSKDLFNCIGNAWNYKLPDIIPSKQRLDCRNHTIL